MTPAWFAQLVFSIMIKKLYKEAMCAMKGHDFKSMVFRAEDFEFTVKVCVVCGDYHMEDQDVEEIIDLDQNPLDAK